MHKLISTKTVVLKIHIGFIRVELLFFNNLNFYLIKKESKITQTLNIQTCSILLMIFNHFIDTWFGSSFGRSPFCVNFDFLFESSEEIIMHFFLQFQQYES